MDPFVKKHFVSTLATVYLFMVAVRGPSISLIEIALKKILRKIWHLPPQSHTGIVHCVSHVHTISNMLYHRFQSFFSRALCSSSSLLRNIFYDLSQYMMSIMVITMLVMLIVPSVRIMVYIHHSNLLVEALSRS